VTVTAAQRDRDDRGRHGRGARRGRGLGGGRAPGVPRSSSTLVARAVPL